jgi:hypothetical protein
MAYSYICVHLGALWRIFGCSLPLRTFILILNFWLIVDKHVALSTLWIKSVQHRGFMEVQILFSRYIDW